MSRSERPAPAAQAWTVTYQPGAISVDLAEADGSAIAEVYVWSPEGELPSLELAYLFRASRQMREALIEVNSLVSSGICVVGHKGKDRYIRLIGQVVDRALAACEPPSADDDTAPAPRWLADGSES